VRVVGADGSQLGIMPTQKALDIAAEQELDLVKIAPTAKPPVCKIMDYGKFRFEQQKKEKEARKNQKIINLKEIRLSAAIEEHDITYKAKNADRFLKDGDKVKASIRFRGREITHTENGYEVMKQFSKMLTQPYVIERRPKMEGRFMIMILGPKESK
jgi:translation initiation factor IF-3